MSGSLSGGIDYFDLPAGTSAKLLVELDYSNQNATEVNRILHVERGWGFGTATEGSAQKERSYVSGNLALNRSIIQ